MKNTELDAATRARAVVKWCAQLEIELMHKIIAAPKVDVGRLQEQEAEMSAQLAEAIAKRLTALAQLSGLEGEGEKEINPQFGGALMKKALEKFRCAGWRLEQGKKEESDKRNVAASKKNAGADLVLPRLHLFCHQPPAST